MTKAALAELLLNARTVPDEAEVVFFRPGGELFRPTDQEVFFVIDQFGQGCPGGLG